MTVSICGDYTPMAHSAQATLFRGLTLMSLNFRSLDVESPVRARRVELSAAATVALLQPFVKHLTPGHGTCMQVGAMRQQEQSASLAKWFRHFRDIRHMQPELWLCDAVHCLGHVPELPTDAAPQVGESRMLESLFR